MIEGPHLDDWLAARRRVVAPARLVDDIMSHLPDASHEGVGDALRRGRRGRVALCGLAAVALLTRVAAWLLVFVPID